MDGRDAYPADRLIGAPVSAEQGPYSIRFELPMSIRDRRSGEPTPVLRFVGRYLRNDRHGRTGCFDGA